MPCPRPIQLHAKWILLLLIFLPIPGASSLAPIVHAANVAWDGGGATPNWTNGNNWNPNGGPVANDDLLFPPGAAQKTSLNNLAADTRFGSISFTDAQYRLEGTTRMQVTNGIHHLAGVGTSIIDFPIRLDAAPILRAVNSDGTLRITGNIQLADGAALTLQDGTSLGAVQLLGDISGSGSVVKAGPGFAELGGANTYSGATTVSGGQLQVRSSGALGSTGSGTTVQRNAILQVAVPNGSPGLTIAEPFNLDRDTTIRAIGSAHTLSGPIAALVRFSALGLEVFDGASLSLTGPISGELDLHKREPGTLLLGGNNTFTGSVVIEEGVLQVLGPQALGVGEAGTLIRARRTLELTSPSVGFSSTLPERIDFEDNAELRSAVGRNTVSGQLRLFGIDANLTSEERLILSGFFTGGGTGPNAVLRFRGSGVHELTGTAPNFHRSTTDIECTTVELNRSDGATVLPADISMTPTCPGGRQSVLRLLANNQIADTAFITVAGLFDLGDRSEKVTGLRSGGGTVLLDRAGAGGVRNPGTLRLGGEGLPFLPAESDATLQGNGTIVMEGPGTQRISTRSPSFTGTLIATGGVLSLDGEAPSARVSVAGGTLDGRRDAGISLGPIDGQAGALRVGLFMRANGGLTASPNMLVRFENADNPAGLGSLQVVGPVVLQNPVLDIDADDILDAGAVQGKIARIIDNDGNDPIQGTFAGVSEAAILEFDNVVGRISYRGGDGNDVTFTTLHGRCGITERPPVSVTTRQVSASVVETTVSATNNSVQPANHLVFIDFEPFTNSNPNALVTVPVQPGVPAQLSSAANLGVAIDPPQKSIRFTVQQVSAGAAATANFDAFDRCGRWDSLAGAGTGVFGGVGAFHLEPGAATIDPGETVSLALRWSVPPPLVWRNLASLRLGIADGSGTALQVRWDEATDEFVTESAASPPAFELLKGSTQGSGPTGTSVVISLPLRALAGAAGRAFTVVVQGINDSGDVQGFERAGTLSVRAPALTLAPSSAVSAVTPTAAPADPDPRPRRLTEEQRQQRRRTDASSLDDTRTEGSIVQSDCGTQPPSVTIAGMDGHVVLRLHGDGANSCPTLAPGVYVRAEGEKVHELLYEIDSIDSD